MKKTLFLTLVFIFFQNTLSSQNDLLNSGWISSIKNISVSPNYTYISVIGEKHPHLFNATSLEQLDVLKELKEINFSIFCSDNVLVFLGNFSTIKYNINNCALEVLTDKVYDHGYSDILSNKLYLVKNNTIDIYEDYTLKKTFELKETVSSIISTKRELIIGYQTGEIEIRNKSNFSSIKTLTGHKTGVTDLSINQTGDVLISGAKRDYQKGEYGEAIFWNTNTDTILFRTKEYHKNVLSTHIQNKEVYIATLRDISIYDLKGDIVKRINTYPNTNPIFTVFKDKLIYGFSSVDNSSLNLFELTLDSNFTKRSFSHESR